MQNRNMRVGQLTLRFLFLSGLALSEVAISETDQATDQNRNQQSSTEESNSPSETIEVVGQRIRSFSKDLKASDLSKTETLDGDSLQRFGAQTLADAISQARGVDTQLFCANCGAKRITINGLRGEHTTVLIDGFPLHSTVSSFYGLDAVPIIGIERIEVNRGSGSSLIVPESIGGSINLITRDPLRNGLEVNGSWGSHGSRQTSVIASGVDDDTGIMVMFDDSLSPFWDEDDNKIAETPTRKSQSLTFKILEKVTDNWNLNLRYSESKLLLLGGNVENFEPQTYSPIQAQPEDFVGGNVRNDYIGDIARISERIRLSRKEWAAASQYFIGDDIEVNLRLSQTVQHQDGIYSHAFDYNNRDEIQFVGLETRWLTDGNHLLTFGLERKQHKMESSSQALFVDRDPALDPDSFEFDSTAFYVMDRWQVNQALRLGLALRFDQIDVEWLYLDQKIDELVVAPRFLANYEHSEHMSSRLTLGIGYRPPLTLFESQHGSSHDGFVVAIDKIEKSQSAVYSFSLNYPSWFSTWSAHWTRISNMAYAIDRISTQQPLLFVNSEDDYDIYVADWYFGGKYHLLDGGEWQVGVESFHYSDDYADKLPTAANEFRIVGDFSQKSLIGMTSLQAVYVGARDLSRYGYDEHFNEYNLDITSSSFNQVSDPKKVKVPDYVLLHLKHQIQVNRDYTLGFRVNNLTNFTQASVDDTPATWHWHETHGHFDNFHTWGPNQGREYFIEIGGKW